MYYQVNFQYPIQIYVQGFLSQKGFLEDSFDTSDKRLKRFKGAQINILKWIFKSLDLGVHQSSTSVSVRYAV